MSEANKISWYKRKEIWGGALTVVSAGLELFAPPHTVGYKVGVLVGIGLSVFGLRQGYQSNNLPSGLSKTLDKVPDGLTGKKGSKS